MKDIKFNKIKFFRFGFLLSWIATFVMVASPLAWAEQSKKINKELIAMVLKEMGVSDNKDITMGEVWSKIRHNFPKDIQDKLDVAFRMYKDEKFPKMDFSEVRNSRGETVVAMNLNESGTTARIEFIGEKDTFLKFNGKSVSEKEVASVTGFANKIKNEQIVKKTAEKLTDIAAKKSIVPSFQVWKKMTPLERAEYVLHLRLLMRETQKVLALDKVLNKKKTPTKTSRLDKDTEFYLKLIFGEPVEAAGPMGPHAVQPTEERGTSISPTKPPTAAAPQGGKPAAPAAPQVKPTENKGTDKPPKKKEEKGGVDKKEEKKKSAAAGTDPAKTEQKKGTYYNGRKVAKDEYCLFGGYPNAKITSHGVCSLSWNPEIRRAAQGTCEPTQVACNPILYGYKREGPPGKSICFDYDIANPATQIATTPEGICEKASPLEDVDQAHAMLKSLVMSKDKTMTEDKFTELFLISNGKINVSEETYKELLSGPDGIITLFNQERDKAIKVCDNMKGRTSEFELSPLNQQTNACEAVKKRAVSVEKFLNNIGSGVVQRTHCTRQTAAVQRNVVNLPPAITRPVPVVREEKIETRPSAKEEIIEICQYPGPIGPMPEERQQPPLGRCGLGLEPCPPNVENSGSTAPESKKEEKSGFPWLGFFATLIAGTAFGYLAYKLLGKKAKASPPPKYDPVPAPGSISPLPTPTVPPAPIAKEGTGPAAADDASGVKVRNKGSK